jgi:hypothetical protein
MPPTKQAIVRRFNWSTQMRRRSNWNKIGKHGHAYETTPVPSTRGVVDITQDVRLKLQILQSMPDYIADADDTG